MSPAPRRRTRPRWLRLVWVVATTAAILSTALAGISYWKSLQITHLSVHRPSLDLEIRRVWLARGRVGGDVTTLPNDARLSDVETGWSIDVRAATSHVPSQQQAKQWFMANSTPLSTIAWMPAWMLSLILWPIAGIAFQRDRALVRRQREGRCPVCGYDLRATPDQCPECGTVATKP